MNTTIPDLWPADIIPPDQPSPVAVLRQQGYLLGQKTRNFVVGEVQSSGSPREFNHEFWISASLLNVRVRVCSVQHGIRFYPAKVKTFDIHTSSGNVSMERTQYEAADLTAFTDIIKGILAEDDVRELIQSLTNQCRDLDNE